MWSRSKSVERLRAIRGGRPLRGPGAGGGLGHHRDGRASRLPLVADPQRGSGAGDDRPLHDGLELADVAGPVVRLQVPHRALGDPENGPAQLAAVLLHEVLHEPRDVLSPLAQGRHRDREDVEPVPEVLAEAAGLHLLVQPAVGGGHEAHVRLQRRGPAHALELAVLDHPQELGLQLEGQLADLVEEEGGAVGDLEAPLALGDGPGESALLVPEELALDEGGRQRRAVELDERPVPAGAQAVERVGDELLPDARLALEEDGARRGRHLLDAGEDVAQDVAARR